MTVCDGRIDKDKEKKKHFLILVSTKTMPTGENGEGVNAGERSTSISDDDGVDASTPTQEERPKSFLEKLFPKKENNDEKNPCQILRQTQMKTMDTQIQLLGKDLALPMSRWKMSLKRATKI